MANQYRSVLASSGPAPTGGDALPAEVLAGKTFTNDNGAQTGTMTNNGAVSQSLSAGQSYTIPEGYHNGNGTVTASEISTLTPLTVSSNYETVSGVSVGDLIIIVQNASGITYTGAEILSTAASAASGITECVYLVKATATTITASSAGGLTSATKLS